MLFLSMQPFISLQSFSCNNTDCRLPQQSIAQDEVPLNLNRFPENVRLLFSFDAVEMYNACVLLIWALDFF